MVQKMFKPLKFDCMYKYGLLIFTTVGFKCCVVVVKFIFQFSLVYIFSDPLGSLSLFGFG